MSDSQFETKSQKEILQTALRILKSSEITVEWREGKKQLSFNFEGEKVNQHQLGLIGLFGSVDFVHWPSRGIRCNIRHGNKKILDELIP